MSAESKEKEAARGVPGCARRALGEAPQPAAENFKQLQEELSALGAELARLKASWQGPEDIPAGDFAPCGASKLGAEGRVGAAYSAEQGIRAAGKSYCPGLAPGKAQAPETHLSAKEDSAPGTRAGAFAPSVAHLSNEELKTLLSECKNYKKRQLAWQMVKNLFC